MPDVAFLQSVSGSAANGGNVTLTFSSASSAIGSSDDIFLALVALGTSRSTVLTITTSAGESWTQMGVTTNSSYARVGVFRLLRNDRFVMTVAGSGGSSDSTTAVGMVFDNVDPSGSTAGAPYQIAISSAGFSLNPDSPSVTITSTQNAVVTAFGGQGNIASVTQPSSFLNKVNVTQNDTIDSVSGMAWITYNSTANFDPAAWTLGSSCAWVAATISLRAAPIIWSQSKPFDRPYFRTEIVGY